MHYQSLNTAGVRIHVLSVAYPHLWTLGISQCSFKIFQLITYDSVFDHRESRWLWQRYFTKKEHTVINLHSRLIVATVINQKWHTVDHGGRLATVINQKGSTR